MALPRDAFRQAARRIPLAAGAAAERVGLLVRTATASQVKWRVLAIILIPVSVWIHANLYRYVPGDSRRLRLRGQDQPDHRPFLHRLRDPSGARKTEAAPLQVSPDRGHRRGPLTKSPRPCAYAPGAAVGALTVFP